MYRVAIITKQGNNYSINSDTREQIDDYLLETDAKEGLKIYRIICKETGEVIEKWEYKNE